MKDQEAKVKPPYPVIDAHVHCFPQRMFEAIWSLFESGKWGVHRLEVEDLPPIMKGHGVDRFTTLNYVRRAGQAAALNQWTTDFAHAHPQVIPFCSLHLDDPDPWSDVAPFLVEHGFKGVKLQPLVSQFALDDPRLRPVLQNLQRLGKILYAHAGTAPYANEHLGLKRLEPVLNDFPDLKIIVAHMGAYEVERALQLLDAHPNLHLDTAMIFVNTNLFNTSVKADLAEIESRSDRILFGSDFPNFPYPYEEAIDSIVRLHLSPKAKQAIFHGNAARLFGLGETGP